MKAGIQFNLLKQYCLKHCTGVFNKAVSCFMKLKEIKVLFPNVYTSIFLSFLFIPSSLVVSCNVYS